MKFVSAWKDILADSGEDTMEDRDEVVDRCAKHCSTSSGVVIVMAHDGGMLVVSEQELEDADAVMSGHL